MFRSSREASRFASILTRKQTRSSVSRLARHEVFLGPFSTRGATYGIRQQSTGGTTSPTLRRSPRAFSTSTALALAVASSLVGFGVATFACQSNGNSDNSLSSTKFGSPRDVQKAITELQGALSSVNGNVVEKVSTNADDLHTHGYSANDHFPSKFFLKCLVLLLDNNTESGISPSVVVYPSSTEDVVVIVKISAKYKIPITIYSGATSLEGHYRAVCISFLSELTPGLTQRSILLGVYVST